METVVYKLGGSLLELSNWPDRLRELWSTRPEEEVPLLVVGGGAVADVVRKWDRVHSLGETISHEIALESLRLTELLAKTLLPECQCVSAASEFKLKSGVPQIVSVKSFLSSPEFSTRSIPANWEFTTDSIAAWIAGALGIRKLVIVKSVSIEANMTPSRLSQQAVVDREFPNWAAEVSELEWCNLRDSSRVIIKIVPDNASSL